MPARSSRHNNKKKTNVHAHVQPSPTPSPPTQLPTPLPEEERIYRPVVSDHNTTTLDAMDVRLIDFDTPTPPPQRYIHPPPEDATLDIDPLQLEDDEDEVLAQTYRSPPFREAHLPDIESDDSPPPLPVPPRGVGYQQEGSHDDYGGSSVASSSSGHTRWPTYPRSNSNSPFRNSTAYPTSLPNPDISMPSPSRRSPSPYNSNIQSSQSSSTFHSLTRTLRSYVPSSIHIPIPSAAPSPPLVSRPVSFGRFTSDSRVDTNAGLGLGLGAKGNTARARKVVSRQEFERDYEREGTEGEEYYQYGAHGYGYGYGQGHEQRHQRPSESSASGLARAMVQNRPPEFDTSPPILNSNSTANASADNSSGPADGMDIIIWARWDVLGDRRFLILAYSTGLQIWDCANLSSISEVLNLNFNSAEWRMVLGSGNRGSTRRQEEGMTAQVIHAALLPALSEARSGVKDSFARDRPLLGILIQMDHIEEEYREECHSSFVLYSLRNHQLVKRLALSGSPTTFAANDQFIILSISLPPTLLVLSSTTFQTLHIIPSTSLELFSPLTYNTTTSTASLGHHSSQSSPAQSPITQSRPVSLARLSIDNATHDNQHRRRQHHLNDPHPVFALSHRLLAYASPSPSSSSSPLHLPSSSKSNHPLSSASSTPSSLSSSPSPFGLGLGSGPIGMNLGKVTNMTQADLGHAALKVGETVLGGMKLLGGMAYGAARSRVSGGGGSGEVGRVSRGGEGLISGGLGGRFVSRSAPDTSPAIDDGNDEVAAERLRERRFSNTSSVSGYHVTTVAPSTKSSIGASGGYYITVVDLSPLIATVGVSGKQSSNEATPNPSSVVSPVKIDEFMSSRSQPIADLHFSADGMNLAVIQRDGYVVKTFKIRPIPSVALPSGASRMDRGDNNEAEKRKQWSTQQASNSAQIYTLRRGRTSAVVEGADWSKDGRWLAIGTRKRTVHVFPVNPYGGKTDIASHLEGRVRNVDVINHPLTELSPLIRLRGTRQSSVPDHPNAPIAFTFISPLDVSQSPRLLPQQHVPISRTSSSPTSPLTQTRQPQFQDVLLFNPVDGVLSLRRLTLDKHFVREQGLGMAAAAASVQALGVTSISLPGMGGAGRLAGSPSRSGGSGNKPSSAVDAPVVELVAQESTVATWHLQRRTDWVEIKQPIIGLDVKPRGRSLGGDWLSQAELTTCSNSRHVLPRSIYLSHQFSFHALCEDYHALIRRHQFDICGEKIQVRKQVEISAHSSGGAGNNNNTSAAFIEGFSAPRDIRRMSSSFDEPIASAISGSFDNSNLPTILPMYPNGIPGSKPKSFRNSIPIRTMAGIGDGVSEGLGRIRREMHKVRSPQLLPRSDSSMSGPVPLEFDEEDEDFQARDVEDNDGSSSGLQVPTTRHDEPSTSRGTSREGGTSAASTSSQDLVTPADASIHHTSQHHLPLVDDSDVVGTVDEEIWSANGWDQQDELAIDEAEQFDDISAVGYLDEEQAKTTPAAAVMPVLSSKRKGRQRRK